MDFKVIDYRLHFSIAEEHLEKMISSIRKSGSRETGGILIGYYTDEGDYAVTCDVTGPPPDSKHGRTTFVRGKVGLDQLLMMHWKQNQYYIGEWHFHPMGTSTPSATDYRQMEQIAANGNYNCPEPIMIIIAGNADTFFVQPYITFRNDRKTIAMTPVK